MTAMKNLKYKAIALGMAIVLSVAVYSSDTLMNEEAGHTIVAAVMHQSAAIHRLPFLR
jgi:hypothetical protein